MKKYIVLFVLFASACAPTIKNNGFKINEKRWSAAKTALVDVASKHITCDSIKITYEILEMHYGQATKARARGCGRSALFERQDEASPWYPAGDSIMSFQRHLTFPPSMMSMESLQLVDPDHKHYVVTW